MPRERLRPLAVSRIGAIAREALAQDGDIEVIAVFERSFYLACPHGIVCIGAPGIGAGPINAEVAALAGVDFTALGVGTGVEGQVRQGRMMIGAALLLDATTGETWRPPTLPPWDATVVRAGLVALGNAATGRLPADGLAMLVFDPGARPSRATVAEMASGPLATLRAALPRAIDDQRWPRDAISAATLLVGLGPGTTPSGDDLLGGVMLALTAARHLRLRDGLWDAIEGELRALTTPLSAMHLAAAADGMALEPLHTLLAATMAADQSHIAVALEAAIRIGHTSGWDAVAGLKLGLDALSATL
jgi:hypothetical protein